MDLACVSPAAPPGLQVNSVHVCLGPTEPLCMASPQSVFQLAVWEGPADQQLGYSESIFSSWGSGVPILQINCSHEDKARG